MSTITTDPFAGIPEELHAAILIRMTPAEPIGQLVSPKRQGQVSKAARDLFADLPPLSGPLQDVEQKPVIGAGNNMEPRVKPVPTHSRGSAVDLAMGRGPKPEVPERVDQWPLMSLDEIFRRGR